MTLEAWYMPSAMAKAAIAANGLLNHSIISHISPSRSDTSPICSHDYAERAAIIEYGAGIPRQWAEAFAHVCLMPRPEPIRKADWQRMIDHAGAMLDSPETLKAFVAHGWSVADVFAVHPAAPMYRQDCKGLLLLMREAETITSITAHAIGLQRAGSQTTLYYRKPIAPCAERIMLWQIR